MISVIIPVYNTKQYLSDCLNSILAQTYTELEILFVDDGSTDGSSDLLDSFAAMDKRIRVIHQENGGVCAARNRGIDEARGEYLSFIDSDDTLEPDMYEVLMGLMKKYGVQIAHCSYQRVTSGVVTPIGNSGEIHQQSREEALRCLLRGKYFVGSCWTKLYAKELFADVRFPVGIRTSEDMLVNFRVFSRAERTVFADVCKYNYLTSETSSCVRTPQRKRAEDLLTVNRQMLTENRCPELKDILEKRILKSLFSCFKAAVYQQERDKTYEKTIISQIDEMYSRGFTFSKRTELEYWMLRRIPGIYKFAYGMYDRIRVPNYDV